MPFSAGSRNSRFEETTLSISLSIFILPGAEKGYLGATTYRERERRHESLHQMADQT